MEMTYYEHGNAVERWERARQFFDAKEYATAARILAAWPDWYGHAARHRRVTDAWRPRG
ncbi:hypothetical protein [Streptomyces sp. NPDC003032]